MALLLEQSAQQRNKSLYQCVAGSHCYRGSFVLPRRLPTTMSCFCWLAPTPHRFCNAFLPANVGPPRVHCAGTILQSGHRNCPHANMHDVTKARQSCPSNTYLIASTARQNPETSLECTDTSRPQRPIPPIHLHLLSRFTATIYA
jgi:hypothetical protein